MTVSSATTRNSYSGNASTTAFAYGFKIFATTDLEVVIRSAAGVETIKTLSTHYSVSGAGVASGGNVTFGSAPASGETVIIRRKLTLTQGTDYVENDSFPANSHEDALDRLTMITQQIQEEVGRSLKASTTTTITTPTFTEAAGVWRHRDHRSGCDEHFGGRHRQCRRLRFGGDRRHQTRYYHDRRQSQWCSGSGGRRGRRYGHHACRRGQDTGR